METGNTEMTAGAIAILFAAVLLGMALFYTIDSVLRQVLLRRIGHATPWSAWIPLWRDVSLYQSAGLKAPWILAIALMVLNSSGNSLNTPGAVMWTLVVLALALTVIVLVWTAFGIQAGAGVAKGAANGWGAVLLVLLPWVWYVWLIVRLGKQGYAQANAMAAGDTFPLFRRVESTQRYEAFAVPQGADEPAQASARPGSSESDYEKAQRAVAPPVKPVNPYLREQPKDLTADQPPEDGSDQPKQPSAE